MVRRHVYSAFLLALTVIVLRPVPVSAQQATGTIAGTATDESNAPLPGASVEVRQDGAVVTSTATDSLGEFALSSLTPGSYTVTVSYVGFSPFEKQVTLTAGQVARVDALLSVATARESVIVTAERAHGEAEAINEEKTADVILNVLPAKIITSLPNANIADAVGRLPSVTLERDEGEGKYVQIRGTEPRLANLTIDGVEVPSPEGGVRQVKLDTIPADLVEAVQINKTLQANQNGDAIGGSVNLVTKKASNQPNLSLYGLGGFAPIANTRSVYEFGGTAGQRFGAEKRLGIMVSGSYDYNGRAIDDLEDNLVSLLPGTFTPLHTQPVFRQYLYDRKRYGFGTSVDYRLSDTSSLYVHSLFSEFNDDGNRYEWIMNDNRTIPGPNVPSFTTEIRNPHFQIASLSVGGARTSGTLVWNWQLAASRARMKNPIGGGESHDLFSYLGATSNCQHNTGATTDPYLPVFTPDCFTEAYNPGMFQLSQIQDSAHGLTAQVNLEATTSVAKAYTFGSHSGVFESGFYIRNAHKFDDSYEIDYCPTNAAAAPLMNQFLSGFTNSDYYGGHYQLGPAASWHYVNSYLQANRGLFDTVSGPCASQTAPFGGNTNNFDLIERVTAGYVMNSLNFARFRLVTGVRFEGTQDDTTSFDTTVGTLTAKGHGSYVNVLPSASLRVRLDNRDNSALRFAYARGLSRPDPAFLTTATAVDNSTTPPTVTIGNPAVKPEHANNIDILYERYLTPLGAIQAGFFYKNITEPIVTLLSGPNSGVPACPSSTCFVSQAGNAGSAYIAGVEVSFQQHFTYLPGLLSGLGLFANYSYATSQATNVNPTASRTDKPPLLRQAPHTWNISPTYDRGRLSLRVGTAYNGANIYSYFFRPFQSDGTPTPGGLKGPSGDYYLYSHFQVDAQGSVYLGSGLTAIVSALNLNNAPFGFFYGSTQFLTQREFYRPTYSFGLRWDLGRGR